MLGPVFRHEMYAAGRKRRYTVLRVVVGIGLLAVMSVIYQSAVFSGSTNFNRGSMPISVTAQMSAAFYGSFVWMTMIGVLVVTPAVAAGAIATERERRTIEYLFATDLSNSEIVLDKLAARLLTVAQLVLATAGVLAIFVLMGGVSGSLLLTHFAMIACAATLSAALSLAVGARSQRARDAVPTAFRVAFVWLISPALIQFMSWTLGYSTSVWAERTVNYLLDPLSLVLQLTNPIWMLTVAGGLSSGVLGVDLNLQYLLISMAVQLFAAILCISVCVATVRKVHLNAAAKVAVKSGATPASLRSPYENRPMLWKEMFAASARRQNLRTRWRRLLVSLTVILFVGTPLIVQLYLAMISGQGMTMIGNGYMPTAMMMTGASGSILMLVVGNRAAGLVTHERESETWLTLITTPLTANEIVNAKILGNLYAFRWHACGVVLISLLGSVIEPLLAVSAFFIAVVLLVCGTAASAIGIWISLSVKSSIKAVGLTTAILLGIGGFLTPIMASLLAMVWIQQEEIMAIIFAPFVPFLCCLPILVIEESSEIWPFVAFGIGVLGYGVLATMFQASAVYRFDELCQRSVGQWGQRESPPQNDQEIKNQSN